MIPTKTIAYAAILAAAIAIVPSSAKAQGTPEQRAACTGDAMSYCGPYIPDVPRITACLRQNINIISPACQAQFRTKTAKKKKKQAA